MLVCRPDSCVSQCGFLYIMCISALLCVCLQIHMNEEEQQPFSLRHHGRMKPPESG